MHCQILLFIMAHIHHSFSAFLKWIIIVCLHLQNIRYKLSCVFQNSQNNTKNILTQHIPIGIPLE